MIQREERIGLSGQAVNDEFAALPLWDTSDKGQNQPRQHHGTSSDKPTGFALKRLLLERLWRQQKHGLLPDALAKGYILFQIFVQNGGHCWDNHWGHNIRTLMRQLILRKKTGGVVKGDLRPLLPVANVRIHPDMDFTSVFLMSESL